MKFNLKGIDYKKLGKSVANSLIAKTKWAALFLALVTLSGCLYLWYGYVYNPAWSQERIDVYIKDKNREVIFNKKGFDDMISEVQKRQESYNKKMDGNQDIFRLK